MSDQFQIVRYKKQKANYEILVKPQTYFQYKEGKISLKDCLYSDTIFTTYTKGDKAKTEDLKVEFGEKKDIEYIKEILDLGEYQVSTQERREMLDKKRREIINYIHKYYIDPRTKKPHPFARIEDAFPLTKYSVELYEPVEKQAALVAKKLIDIQLPLSKTEMEATVRVKHAFLGTSMACIKKYCTVKKDSYDNEGCTMDVLLIPGDYEIFLKEMNAITKGEFEFDIVGAPKINNEDIEKKGKGQPKGGKGGKKK